MGGLAMGTLGASAGYSTSPFVATDGPEVLAADEARSRGPVVEFRVEARTSEVDLGGRVMPAWCYGGAIPGTPVRVKVGDRLKATMANRLPHETSIHWHGIPVRNDADGVPHLTQEPVAPGADYTYQFTATHPGTYWFHPHTGTQLDRGLYSPLIVEDPNEPLVYDNEWIVVLDDWTERDPDEVLADLEKGMTHAGMGHTRATSNLLGGDAGNVQYPYFILNGRSPADAAVFQAKPGQRVRIRFLNAGSDTVFRVAVGGHQMQVTHADGYAVVPVQTDALLLGMGERYDVIVTLGDGVFPLVALAEGKNDAAFAIIRTGGGEAPPASVRPAELNRHIVSYRQLKPAAAVEMQSKLLDRSIRLQLTGSMRGYNWGFNGKRFDHAKPLKNPYEVVIGERVRLDFINTTGMFHPVHLHGHTFALGSPAGPRKDTAIVLPGQVLKAYFDADNPGLWMIHCHNVYHAAAGMMAVLAYRREA
ncbi:multicopper oxidase MmcO [Rhizocola hellebori]|uniref:Multicopper oxidase MmcO n=1 Tax=Rhizocola hellebori TaxID=1392758 RepID=A0A8J3VGI5_9ACTN|nr:multicopper oxidase MmcO [Rhizocola hellebori]